MLTHYDHGVRSAPSACPGRLNRRGTVEFTPEAGSISDQVLEFVRSNEVRQVDLRFTDISGTEHRVSYPAGQLEGSSFEDGFGIEGVGVHTWAAMDESGVLLIPDASTAVLDPFSPVPTLMMVGDVIDPITRQHSPRDPRSIAKRAESHLLHTRVADTAYFGAQAGFSIFKDHPRDPQAPRDRNPNLCGEMVRTMIDCGLKIGGHQHESATSGQCEIDQRFDTLLRSADNMMLYKYIVRNVASSRDRSATFMPMPLFGGSGSSMHTRQSLWKAGKPLFSGEGYAGLSDLALYYMGGLLKHSRALSAIVAPTTNSYKRLVADSEAPVRLAYSRRNRSAVCYIPMYSVTPSSRRIEYRPPDPSANPYLAFPAMLMAGLDGILNRIDPGGPLDKDIYDLKPEELKKVGVLPESLDEALRCLEEDHEFLLRGDVFSEHLIEAFIRYKRTREADAIRTRPHPHEFALYYDV